MIGFIPVRGIPEVHPGDDLPALLGDALERDVRSGDVLIVTHKVVSKAEGRLVDLATVEPSDLARRFAAEHGRDARQVEVVLRESRRVLRMAQGLIISETPHGYVCANAGVDLSNAGGTERAVLLPADPDASARELQERLSERFGFHLPVVVSDSFGRPWRFGIVNVAIGVAGLSPLTDYRGTSDPDGYLLNASVMATADALASGAELAMGKIDGVPLVIVRGFEYRRADGSARELVLDPARNLFP